MLVNWFNQNNNNTTTNNNNSKKSQENSSCIHVYVCVCVLNSAIFFFFLKKIHCIWRDQWGKKKANKDLDTWLFGQQIYVGDRGHDGNKAVEGTTIGWFANLGNALFHTTGWQSGLRVMIPAFFNCNTQLGYALGAQRERKEEFNKRKWIDVAWGGQMYRLHSWYSHNAASSLQL